MYYSTQSASGNDKHYEWQLLLGHCWLRIENDHVIETHYCQPGAKGIAINTVTYGQVFIDFDTLQTLTAGVKVQRLSFLPQVQAQDVGWYYRDDLLWREYGSQGSGLLVSSISSKDVEHQFTLGPQGSFTFTVASTTYTLDFSTMTQTNNISGLSRNVRRRPKVTQSHHRTSFLPMNLFFQPTVDRFKWEFMGDEGEWNEYQANKCSYDSTAIERQYQLNATGQVHFKANRFSYTLDFSSMCQVNNNIGTRRAVRRTAVDGTQQESSTGTQPRWQFRDIDGRWKDYSKSVGQCSVSSQDIEAQYQKDPSGTMTFATSSFKYELDFSAMTQKNQSTNTIRPLQRLNQ
ncbi:protein mono-ADP-ribosyltransferase PARP12 isoform X2 [Genypterus blacodes]